MADLRIILKPMSFGARRQPGQGPYVARRCRCRGRERLRFVHWSRSLYQYDRYLSFVRSLRSAWRSCGMTSVGESVSAQYAF
jgi:hypothetical protein